MSAPFGLSTSLPASARASMFPYGFILSTIALGIRIVALGFISVVHASGDLQTLRVDATNVGALAH
ncbi:MAG: hypothetical protein ABSG12_09260 [Steroidobacteraceae bacterium]